MFRKRVDAGGYLAGILTPSACAASRVCDPRQRLRAIKAPRDAVLVDSRFSRLAASAVAASVSSRELLEWIYQIRIDFFTLNC